MTNRTNIERLNQIPPRTGRQITEDGEIISNSQKTVLEFFSNASELALAGMLNFAKSVETVNADESITFVIKTGANHICQFARNLTVSSSFWEIEVLTGGSFSGGTLITSRNTRIGEAAFGNTVEIYSGSTVLGATVGEIDFIAASSRNKDSGISGAYPGAIITYPPNSIFAVRCSNKDATNDSSKISFQYIFSEITPTQMQKIRGIYVI